MLLQKAIKKILLLLKEAEDLVKNLDKTKAHNVLNIAPKIEKSIDLLSREIIKSDFARMNIFNDSLNRIYGYIRNIAELTISEAIIKK